VSGSGAAKPEWVRAIDAGLVPPIAAEASRPLERDALLAEARARLGLSDGGIADFCGAGFEEGALLEPLDRVTAALEREAELTLTGRWLTRRFLLRLLEVRLQLMATLRADPGVRDEPIEAPLFVAGAPRTGTTILHALLAADPAHRAPLGWELLRPVPPPDPDPARRAGDARIALADAELVLPQTVVTGLLAIHEYGARRPKECLSAMSFAFLSEEFTARYHVPSYEAWLERADPAPAYAMHRLVLQVLQRRTGPAAWVLKSPVHLHALPALFAAYPDARVAVTHRDPLVMLASLASLVAALRRAHSDRVDEPAIAAALARRWRESLDRLVRWTEAEAIPTARMHHSRYADFLRDPLATVEALCARFGRPFPPETRARMREALLARPRDEHGAHAYAVDAPGAGRAALRASFRAYQARFGVPDEA
jgi:hypothetical protein